VEDWEQINWLVIWVFEVKQANIAEDNEVPLPFHGTKGSKAHLIKVAIGKSGREVLQLHFV